MEESEIESGEYYDGFKVVPVEAKKQLKETVEKLSPGSMLVEIHSNDHQDLIQKLIFVIPDKLNMVFLMTRAYFKLLMKNNFILPRLEMLLQTSISQVSKSQISKSELDSKFSSLSFQKSSETRVTLRIINVLNEAEYHYSNHWVVLSEKSGGSVFGAIDLDSHNEVNLKCRAQILNTCTMIEVGLTHKGKRITQRTVLSHEVVKSDDKSKIYMFTVGDGEMFRLRFFIEASKFYYKSPKYFSDNSMQFLISKILIRLNPPNIPRVTSCKFRDTLTQSLAGVDHGNYRFNILIPSLQQLPKSCLGSEPDRVEPGKKEADPIFGEHAFQEIDPVIRAQEKADLGQSDPVEGERKDLSSSKSAENSEQPRMAERKQKENEESEKIIAPISTGLHTPALEIETCAQSQTDFKRLPCDLDSKDKPPSVLEKLEDALRIPPAGNRLVLTQSPNLGLLAPSIQFFVPIMPIWNPTLLVNPISNIRNRMTQLLNYFNNKPQPGSSRTAPQINEAFLYNVPNRVGAS